MILTTVDIRLNAKDAGGFEMKKETKDMPLAWNKKG